jgi:predicted O-methyltransferase YrrM
MSTNFEYKFSVDWFSSNIPHLSKILFPLKGQKLKALEIGSYEGLSSVWFCQNILTHPESQLTCIDVFDKVEWLKNRDSQSEPSKFETFTHNVSPFCEKIKVYVGPSFLALKDSMIINYLYDFIYVDGDHRAVGVLEDAIMSFRLLKVGGLMIFDDYLGGERGGPKAPKKGVDTFLDFYSDRIKVIYNDYQVVIEKVAE